MFHRRQRLDYFTPPPPPPPPLQTPPSLQLPVTPKQESHSSTNLNPSLLIIAIILILVFFISASIHLILRYLNRRCNSIEQDDDVASNEPVHIVTRISSRRVVPEDHRLLIDSLPLFSFNSISGLRSSSADCAVCLSKFEPHDQLRLLPVCCHVFHSNCIDTWLISNHTCPLCRSTVHVDESDAYLKLISSSRVSSESFRVEIGNISSRRIGSDNGNDRRRSYSIGSFEYLVENDSSEVIIVPTHHRRDSENVFTGKKDETSSSPPAAMTTTTATTINPPGSEVAAEVGEGRGWLKEYVDRLASSSTSSISSRALSFRFSGRFFTGSSRRSEAFTGSSRRSNNSAVNAIVHGGSWDLEGNQYGEEIGNFLRWISGV